MKTIEAAIKHFGVTEDELLDDNRRKGVISKARHFIMWYHRHVLKESYYKCGMIVCLSKGSALYGVKSLHKKIKEDSELSSEMDDFIALI